MATTGAASIAVSVKLVSIIIAAPDCLQTIREAGRLFKPGLQPTPWR